MDEDATNALMELLFEGTNVGWLKWSETSDESTYQVSLSHYSILLDGPSPESSMQIRVYDEDARLLVILYNDEILSDLFPLVRRKILGIDEAIHNIVESLTEKRRLWDKENTPSVISDEDLPF